MKAILYSLLCFFFINLLIASCRKIPADTGRTSCSPILPKDGFFNCNGKLIHPTLGTVYYQNVNRHFQTTGSHTLSHQYTFSIGSLGYSLGGAYINTQFNLYLDSSVIVSSGSGSSFIANPIPNINWYDTCTGSLYIKYTLHNGATISQVCDTCFFN